MWSTSSRRAVITHGNQPRVGYSHHTSSVSPTVGAEVVGVVAVLVGVLVVVVVTDVGGLLVVLVGVVAVLVGVMSLLVGVMVATDEVVVGTTTSSGMLSLMCSTSAFAIASLAPLDETPSLFNRPLNTFAEHFMTRSTVGNMWR